MGWQRLMQFVVLGSRQLEEYAILAVRIALGLFFAISGANKLFVPQQTQVMYETLVAAHVPLPRLMTYFVSSVEFRRRLDADCGISMQPGLSRFTGRYVGRHSHFETVHAAQRGFASELARQFSLSSGSALRTLLRLVDLFWSRQIQRGSLDRYKIAAMTDNRCHLRRHTLYWPSCDRATRSGRLEMRIIPA